MGSKYTQAQAQATKNYMENRTTLRAVVTKERYETIKEHAMNQGESISSFINRAIDEQIARDRKL